MSTGAESKVSRVSANASALRRELAWFEAVLLARLNLRFGQSETDPRTLAAPQIEHDSSDLATIIRDLDLTWSDRLVLMLAVAPHLRPRLLDPFLVRDPTTDRGFTDFGGWKGRAHGGFLPTGETAAFLVSRDDQDLETRFGVASMFDSAHPFQRRGVLRLDHEAAGEPFLSGALLISDEALTRLTTGETHKPDFSATFPAKLISTNLDWSDLVLAAETRAEIETVRGWIVHSGTILDDWGLKRVLKPGYRSLFYGPPGTGKTLTAMLIGKDAGADVYRIDLSMVVSKYIGETEKNLATVFDQAQTRDWILFFDEADALFGKRTATSSSNDRYANQEVSYLLQRVEDFPGNVILATNLKANIDEAFARRFQSMVHFPMPDADQRRRLWDGIIGREARLDDNDCQRRLADRYELSGGAITNVVRFGAISALRAGRDKITADDLERGAVKELRKEGRTV